MNCLSFRCGDGSKDVDDGSTSCKVKSFVSLPRQLDRCGWRPFRDGSEHCWKASWFEVHVLDPLVIFRGMTFTRFAAASPLQQEPQALPF